MQLQFLGAAGNVTGSSYLIEHAGARLLIDCGYYQERDFQKRNWDAFPARASEIDAVLLTHAHLDHCGLLPKLVREGFKGRIFCTAPTAEITGIVLLDAARLQMEDAEFKKKRHAREGRQDPRPVVPLYTIEDAEAVLPLLTPIAYDETFEPLPGFAARMGEAGHILGSAWIQLRLKQAGGDRVVLFSGDIGRYNAPLLCDPVSPEEADLVVIESTYGNRDHAPTTDIPELLANIVNETVKAGGNIIIPSFAIERAQELLYHISGLLRDRRIPPLPVFLDSPMAVRVTDVFAKFRNLFDAESLERLRTGDNPCAFPGLQFCRTSEESKAINAVESGAIIIAGAGMCTGGRIKHHLVRHIERPESTILFVGYQARGTLGRIILDKPARVRILGREHDCRARIAKLNGFSGHAGRDELTRWIGGLKRPPSRVFTTHGEPEVTAAFADWLTGQLKWKTTVPAYLDRFPLDA